MPFRPPSDQQVTLPEIKHVHVHEIVSLETAKQNYPNLFRDLGMLSGEYHISLKEGAKPYALTVPRKVGIQLLPKVKQELANGEKQSYFPC